jgi:hypothetical protein
MSTDGFRLYAGQNISSHATFELAKEAAHKYMPNENYLRIEILVEIAPGDADWWAYEYDKNEWVPS